MVFITLAGHIPGKSGDRKSMNDLVTLSNFRTESFAFCQELPLKTGT
jgi:hypothetical protein